VKVETGRRLVDLHQDDDGVDCWIEDADLDAAGWGRSEPPSTDEINAPVRSRTADADRVRASFLAGCDGGRSTVRTLAGLRYESRREDFGFAGMVADVQVDGIEPTYMRMWFGPDGKEVVLSPQPETHNFQFIAQLDADTEGTYPEPTLALAQELLERRSPVQGLRLHDMTWQTVFKVRESLAERYRDGRVFIAGDAAHLHSPMGGQGANSGVQDAYNLGWKLAYVLKNEAPADLLDTYDAERRPVAETLLQWTGDAHKEMFGATLRGRIVHRWRHRASQRANADRSFAELMNGLGTSYPDSWINGGDRDESTPTVGDRAPDGHLIETVTGRRLRLFDVTRGDHFTLLLFGTPLAPLAAAMTRFRTTLRRCVIKGVDDRIAGWEGETYVDSNGRLAAAYHAGRRPIVLIRPDGYIAFHGTADAGPRLLEHLQRLLPQEQCQE
jgi:flavin-dependent dehydrogenase